MINPGEGPNLSESEDTLKRVVDRIAKFIQADKCVFLLHDGERNELRAVSPALGLSKEQIAEFRTDASGDALSAFVYRTNTPVIVPDVAHDPRAAAERLSERLGVRSAICVPLIIEKRDDENNIIDRNTIGVLYAINKTTGEGTFADEDRRLLERMSLNVASIISSVQVFREAVQEKQELIHTIESLYIGLLVVGTNRKILQINPPARRILHIPEGLAVLNMRLEDAIGDESLRALLGRALEAPQTGEVAGEITFPIEPQAQVDGEPKERIYQVQCAPVRAEKNDKVVGITAIFTDITEIRSIERMKTAFISTVSHELRTPLTSIKGFVSTLLADKEGFYDHDTKIEFYRIIDTECDRLTRLIEDLLNVSRIEQGKAMQLNIEDVNIVAIAEKVAAAQRAYTSSERHQLVVDFPPDFPLVEADADKIDQILTNLVNNAIKYSPQGGQVKTSGRVNDADQTVTLRVSDQGMGIPRDHIKKVFERFHRVDNRDNREIGGTGIGLFLVKSLSEAHHGVASIESDLGKGSTFIVTIPIHQPKE
ncbi:MAG TPA: ATP-binding protein [Capsulimonadaceae bacterium]|nr:ATP-binding protein [Capsulimonadaceae bacterium]